MSKSIELNLDECETLDIHMIFEGNKIGVARVLIDPTTLEWVLVSGFKPVLKNIKVEIIPVTLS